MVVDDSRVVRELVRDSLYRARFQVLEAAGSQEALRTFDRIGPVDLLLVSWNLPRRDALPLVRALRSRTEFAPMRIVMMTPAVDAGQVIECVRAGVDDCLVKPFTRNMLLEKIAVLHRARPS